MIDLSKRSIMNMLRLNNQLIEIIDASKVSPLEAAMVLRVIQEQILVAFEQRVKEVK